MPSIMVQVFLTVLHDEMKLIILQHKEIIDDQLLVMKKHKQV